jgi:hypothetical protein
MVLEAGSVFQVQDKGPQYLGADGIDVGGQLAAQEELVEKFQATGDDRDSFGGFPFGVGGELVTVN